MSGPEFPSSAVATSYCFYCINCLFRVFAAGTFCLARPVRAISAEQIAHGKAAGRTPVPSGPFLNPGAGNIGGLNLIPGLYKFTGTALITGTLLSRVGPTMSGSSRSRPISRLAAASK